MHGLDEQLEMHDNFNVNENVIDDFVVQKDESLNTPGPKKESTIRIISNRKISGALDISALAANQPNDRNVTKIMTKLATQSTTGTTASMPSSSKILMSMKPKSLQSPIFKLASRTDGSGTDHANVSGTVTAPKTIANAATLTTIDGKPAVKTAEGKILFIQKASGFGQVGGSSSQLGGVRLQSSATATALAPPAASSTSISSAPALLKTTSIVNAKPIGSISGQPFGHTIMTIVPKTTTHSTGAGVVAVLPKAPTTTMAISESQATTRSVSESSPTVAPIQMQVTKSLGTKATITRTLPTKNEADSAIGTATTTKAGTSMKPATAGNEPKTSKITPKPMQIQIVRTSDGKLVKLKQANIVGGDSAPKTSIVKSTAMASNAFAPGKVIIKTPIRTPTSELITKNLTIKKVTSTSAAPNASTSATSSTKPATTSPATTAIKLAKGVAMSPPTSATITKMLLTGAIKPAASQPATTTTTKLSGGSTVKVVNAAAIDTKTQPTKFVATTRVGAALASEKATVSGTSSTSVPTVVSKIMTVSSASGTTIPTGSPTATTMAGKVVVQSKGSGAGGKPTVVSSQQLIKLSPKAGSNATVSKVTSVPPGSKFQTVQLPGKGGIKYVRVLPRGATTSSAAPTAAAASAEKALTPKPGVSTLLAQSAVSKATTATTACTTSSTATATTSKPASALATNTILNSTLAATPTAPSSNSSGFKILNSTPQKFTLVRSSQGTTKFLLKQSPNKDGPVTVVTLPQKKIISNVTSSGVSLKSKAVDDTAAVAATSSSATSSAAIEGARKHKLSDNNMEIKRITSNTPAGVAAAGGNAAGDDKEGPEPKKPRYVFVPHNQLQYSKVGNQSQITRAGYTLQRVSSSTPTAASGSESAGNNAGGGINKNRTATSKQVYSILRTNKGNGTKSYVVCNKATGQKSITLRRPIPLNETMQKTKKILSTSEIIARKEKTFKNDAVRTQGVPLKFAPRPQFVAMKQTNISIAATTAQSKAPSTSSTSSTGATVANSLDTVLSRRKHCNCSKSQCLKLYCDCFANGEFCQDCTCKDCFNNLQYEDERQRAIKSCLDRNPSAFKPKITARQHSDMRLHNKGCNCKRSGCLKNYCECYEAKIPCSSICKCVGCRNMEDRPDVDMDYLDSKTLSGLTTDKRKIKSEPTDVDGSASTGNNFITDDVIDATIMCMLSQLTECEKQDMQEQDIEKQIMEELGRCLVEIIDFSIRNSDSILLDESKGG